MSDRVFRLLLPVVIGAVFASFLYSSEVKPLAIIAAIGMFGYFATEFAGIAEKLTAIEKLLVEKKK